MNLADVVRLFNEMTREEMLMGIYASDPAWGLKAPVGAATGEFWIVLREDDTRSFRHATEEAAVKEAERLATTAPGRKFYVLRPLKVAEGAVGHAPVGEHFRTTESHLWVQVLPNPDSGDHRIEINGEGRNYCRPSDLRDAAAFLQREADRIEKPVVRTRTVFCPEAGF